MRMLLKVEMQTEAASDGIRSGSLPQLIGSSLEALNAEAAYFLPQDGMRTALIFFDMKDITDLPSIVEPFFQGLNAKITLTPAMNAQDMQSGVAKAMEAR